MRRALAAASLAGIMACAGAPSRPPKPTPVSLLLDAAGARTDPAWGALLGAHGHRDVASPAGLRRLLLGREPLRLQMSVAYKREAAKDSVSWWLGEVGWPGTPDEVRGYLKDSLSMLGFKAADAEEGMVFTSTSGALLQWVEIEGPRPWTGGDESASGVSMLWSVDRSGSFPTQPLGEILEAWPSLRESRMDPALLQALSSWPSAAVSFGGSHPRYYVWEAVLLPRPGEASAAVRERLRVLLIEADFVPDRREKGRERFWRERTGSQVLLWDPDLSGQVRLSYQAET